MDNQLQDACQYHLQMASARPTLATASAGFPQIQFALPPGCGLVIFYFHGIFNTHSFLHLYIYIMHINTLILYVIDLVFIYLFIWMAPV
jgi:hypothetical protein